MLSNYLEVSTLPLVSESRSSDACVGIAYVDASSITWFA